MQYASIPGWILVAFSIDKMLNMRASKPNILKSKLFQWSVVAGIVLFYICLYFVLLITLKLEPMMGIYLCNLVTRDYFNAFVYVQITMTCAIPFIIMITTSVITIKLLLKSRASLKRNANAYKKRRIRDMKYAISSIVFNVYFIVFKMPFAISPLIPDENLYFLTVSLFLFIVNCSSTFFVHLATNSIFCSQLLVIFRFIKPLNNRILVLVERHCQLS
jgi:hypothetical protein